MQLVIAARNSIAGPVKAAVGSLGSLKVAFVAMAAVIGVAVAAVAAWVAVLGKTKGVIEDAVKQVSAMGDELQKTSIRLGTTVENLDALSFAAERSGASAQSITTAYRTLARAATEAADGAVEYADVFNALGVSIKDGSGKLRDLDELFLDVADSVAGMESETEALGLAQQVLGRAATDLMVLLKEERGGIEALKDEAIALGGVMSTELADASAAYVDAQRNMQEATQGVRNEIAEAFLPILIEATNELARWVAANKKNIGSMAVGLAGSFKRMTDAVIPFIKEYGPGVMAVLGGIAGVSAKIAAAMVAAANAVMGLGDGQDEAAAATDNYREKAEALAEALVTAGQAGFVNEGQREKMRELTGDIITLLGGLGGTVSDTTIEPVLIMSDRAKAEAIARFEAEIAKLVEGLTVEAPVPEISFVGQPETLMIEPPNVSVEPPSPESLGLPSLDFVAEHLAAFQEAYGEGFTAFLQESYEELSGVEDPIGMLKQAEQIRATAKELAAFGKRAEKIFFKDFARGAGQAIKSMTHVVGAAMMGAADTAEKAKQVWKSFVASAIASLLQLIAKLTIAAILSAFIGVGKFATMKSAMEFLSTDLGMQKGGPVGGPGSGDNQLRLLDPREYVIRPEAVAYHGQQVLDLINAARAPIASTGAAHSAGVAALGRSVAPVDQGVLDETFRPQVGIETLQVHTILGTEEEGRALARGVFQYAMQEGYV